MKKTRFKPKMIVLFYNSKTTAIIFCLSTWFDLPLILSFLSNLLLIYFFKNFTKRIINFCGSCCTTSLISATSTSKSIFYTFITLVISLRWILYLKYFENIVKMLHYKIMSKSQNRFFWKYLGMRITLIWYIFVTIYLF